MKRMLVICPLAPVVRDSVRVAIRIKDGKPVERFRYYKVCRIRLENSSRCSAPGRKRFERSCVNDRVCRRNAAVPRQTEREASP
jgi:hypothetical protein